MKREIIEDMAEDYVRRLYEKDEYPVCAEDIEIDVRTAFEDGARWRINSVWNNGKVEPNRNLDKKVFGCGEDILMKPKYRQLFEICEVLWDEDEQKIYLSGERETFLMDDVEIWSYVSDLLPERKEETE